MEVDVGAAAATTLHRERSILRHANDGQRCSMHCSAIFRGNAMGFNQGIPHDHGLGRVEANAMVIASLRLN